MAADSAVMSDMMVSLCARLDKEYFYKFGKILHENFFKKTKLDIEQLRHAAHHYLNFFRQSSFLLQLNNDNRWEKLIYLLIRESNYNLAMIFKQRTKEYNRKTLFKIIKGNNVKNYSWQNISEELTTLQKCLLFL